MKMNFNKTGMRRAVIINIVYFAMIAGIIYILLRNFVPMFAPFLIGFFLASVLAPLIRRICRRVEGEALPGGHRLASSSATL